MERYLMHHGVEGQKWGVRRWQNPDGSLTPAGREHVNNFLQDLNVGTPFRNKSNEEHDRCFGTGNIAKVKHELFDDWQGRMKKAGYGGMVDANDSQTMSKRATYLFGDDNTAFNKQKQREVAYNPIEKVKDRFYDPTNAFDRNKLKDYYDK